MIACDLPLNFEMQRGKRECINYRTRTLYMLLLIDLHASERQMSRVIHVMCGQHPTASSITRKKRYIHCDWNILWCPARYRIFDFCLRMLLAGFYAIINNKQTTKDPTNRECYTIENVRRFYNQKKKNLRLSFLSSVHTDSIWIVIQENFLSISFVLFCKTP